MRIVPLDKPAACILPRPSLLTLMARATRRLPSFTRPREPDRFEREPPPLSYSRFLYEQNRAGRAGAQRLRFCPHCPCEAHLGGRIDTTA
ncbi:MAG: hypothetical protein WD749_15285 [Phycisphaerales bacterium]